MRYKKSEYVVAKDRVKLRAGDMVRISCEMMDISQAELARRSGIAESHISAMISGNRPIGKNVAERLAKILNVSPAVILFAGEKSREGADLGTGIDVSLLERAIQTVEENKNGDTNAQLGALRLAVEFIAKAILSISHTELAPVGLISHFAKRSHALHAKRRS